MVGGIALFGALTSGPAGPQTTGPTATAASTRAAKPQETPQSSTPVRPPTLQIKVTGAPTRVYVAVPGGDPSGLKLNGLLNTGEVRRFDDARLDVVVTDGAAVEVSINGEVQAKGRPGQRQNWTAVREP